VKHNLLRRKRVKKTTVKEVKKWMKTLEENRYKKTYASDARRVSWMVNNNLSEDYEAMPISMKKKWPKAAYKRERFLAKEFVKHLEARKEAKLRESIRKIVHGFINEQIITEAKRVQLILPARERKRADVLLKKLKLKSGNDFDYGVGKGATFIIDLDKKHYNKVIELFISKDIQVRG